MDVYMQAQPDHHQKMVHQFHRRGPMMRYNSIDNGLLASPYGQYPYVINNSSFQNQHNQSHHQMVQVRQQPPLLPLPTPKKPPQFSSLPLKTSSGKLNNSKVARKSKNESANYRSHPKKETAGSLRSEPGSKNKPIRSDYKINAVNKSGVFEDQQLRLSDLVFTLSPHPSSLPLPKFFIRQRSTKLSCKTEVESRAANTNDLLRILQLP